MYSDNDPPLPQTSNEYPTFNTVVTMENCWYYLSLLERFVDTTKDMTEDTLKLYLVRAEYRYFQWMSKKVSNRKLAYSIPPVDVAFLWQAHMLSPLRYYEDTLRMPPFLSTEIPLKAIHDLPKTSATKVYEEWNLVMKVEPYHLTKKALLEKTSYASVTCIVCFAPIQSTWEEYTEWRTDHTVALQCHCCAIMFTVKHVGKANLFADNQRKSLSAGLLIDHRSKFNKSSKEHKLLQPISKTKSLPFNRGLKPLNYYIIKKQGSVATKLEIQQRKRVIDAIQSTYLCSPYRGSSIDLIQATARQYKFAYKATKLINWDSPQGIIKGIRHYSGFLALIKDNPNLIAVPTFEIDLAWHTHMLHHSNYRSFTNLYIGKLINHDDNIPEEKLNQHVQKTDRAWKARSEKRKEALAPPPPPPKESPVVEEVSSNEKKKGLKSKLKSIFSSSTPTSSNVVTPRYSSSGVNAPKNGYMTEERLFKGKYNPGTYKSSPPYVPKISSDEENEEKEVDDNGYDKQKISFHDKRDIKEFITLKNSNTLMDQEFASVKNSVYGFIGTSNCANTDYLDQWDTSRDVKGGIPKCLHSQDGDSKYTKVFPTFGDRRDFSLKIIRRLPKADMRQYNSFREPQNIQYNSTGDAFNWYLISMAWGGAAIASNNASACSGWSSCGKGTSYASGCGGGSFGSSCGGGGFSSCGGFSSSCGSSCGGGGSSCGGGGC